jgi:NhaA family Na+:H+ antiporter
MMTNSASGEQYSHFWHLQAGISTISKPIEFWINDGLMAIFFLLVGLEIKRELLVGELSNIKNAILPIAAAAGGMIIPALIHFLLNNGLPTQSGFGIPMATDIAFALGALSLLGNRVPVSLKIFLTALAIIDDLGAILVIALFYAKGFSGIFLLGSFVIFGVLFILNKLKIQKLWIYLLGGIGIWYCMLQSGIHATLAGVLLAFSIPSIGGDESLSSQLQHFLHKPVAFFIMPLFALANTCLFFESGWYSNLTSANDLGIILGLFIGKPIGIFLFTWLFIKIGWGSLASEISLKQLFGLGLLGGIGFTMSIFISNLAFSDAGTIVSSKIAILLASLLSGIAGYFMLLSTSTRINTQE